MFSLEPNLSLHLLLSLIVLFGLELVLSVDNLIFLSLKVAALPKQQQQQARKLGIALALLTRLLLLALGVYLTSMSKLLFDLFFIIGGLFLFVNSCLELRNSFQGKPHAVSASATRLAPVLLQIMLIDLLFSIDTVVTAVGMVRVYWVMALAVILSALVMLFASKHLIAFIEKHVRVKRIAIVFLMALGFLLLAEGLQFKISIFYLYIGLACALLAELFVNLLKRKHHDT